MGKGVPGEGRMWIQGLGGRGGSKGGGGVGGRLLKMLLSEGAWVAQSDFSLGHDLAVPEFKPLMGLCADSSEPGACFRFCLSLSLSLSLSAPPPTHSLSLSLPLKNKY